MYLCISYYFLYGINKPSFSNVFLAGITTEATWIPVQSAGGGENTLRPQNQDQSINKTIHLVEKALKIGVPSFCVIFIGAFFAVGFCLIY